MTDGQITVVIPCKNEQNLVPICIKALLAEQKEFGVIFDIILVDNGSTDESVRLVEQLGVKVSFHGGTISEVRNYGAGFAKTDFIAFIDADVEVTRGWSKEVKTLLSTLGSRADSATLGYVYNLPIKPSWVESVWYKSLVSRKHINYIEGGNLIISRSLFEKLGGFDESLITGEDVDLCSRVRECGGSVVLDPSIDVIHHGYPKILRIFYIRERWHGIGSLRGGKLLSSKAGYLSCLTLIYAFMSIALVALGFFKLVALMTLSLIFAAWCFCAKRLNKVWSIEPIQLCILFVIYSLARAHALLDRMIYSGKAREFSARQKGLPE